MRAVLPLSIMLLVGTAACGPKEEPLVVGQVAPNARNEKRGAAFATVDEAFAAFTTNEGAKTFFARETNIEPRVGGAYEMFFFPEAPPGERGSEGAKFLELEPGRRFVVSWPYPARYPEHRGKFLRVEVTFEKGTPRAGRPALTNVTVLITGFIYGATIYQEVSVAGSIWDAALGRFARRFEKGPLDLANDPTVRER